MTKLPREVADISINEQTPVVGRIAWWLENSILRSVKRLFNLFTTPLTYVLSYGLEYFFDLLEETFLLSTKPITNRLLNNSGIPDDIKQIIRKAYDGGNASDFIVSFMQVWGQVVTLAGAAAEPYNRITQYNIEKDIRTHIPDPSTLVAMERLGSISNNYLNDGLSYIGVSEEFKQGYRELFEKYLSLGEMAQCLHRGTLEEANVRKVLSRQGLDDKHIEAYLDLINIIPSPQDLIRIAVREGWNEAASKQFGYDDDYPTEFGEWTEKQGLSDYWAKKFWRAHWELPGIQAGFDMLHRRIIDPDQLQLLLKARDIPSFWRKSLTKLSYNPYTRVDVRRMFELGVVDETEVYENYLDLGYSEDRAKKLTQWTVLEYTPNELQLTKSDIYKSYVEGILNTNEAIELYRAKNVDDDSIALYMQRAELQKQEEYEKEFVENIRLSFVGKEISENDVIIQLNTLDPPEGFIDTKLSIWRLQRDRELELPTKSDIKAFFVNGIIDEDLAKDYLKRRGNEPFTIEAYIILWSQEAEV